MEDRPLEENIKRYIRKNYNNINISSLAHEYSVSPVKIENYIIDELLPEKEVKIPRKEKILYRNLFWVLILFLLGLILSINVSKMTNNDIWIHLKNGELILKNKQFLYTDTYSFRTIGMAWINHEWLTDVIFYMVYRMSQVNGLIFLKALIFIIIAIILLRTSAITKGEFIFFLPLIVFAQYNFAFLSFVRPHIFTYLFVALYIYVLFAYKYQRRELLWILPIFHLIWVNIHGGWFVGSVLLFTFTFMETLRLFINRNLISFWQKDLISWPRQKKLYLILIITTLLIVLNPMGFKMYTYPLKITTQSIFMSQIFEWQPPFSSHTFNTSYAFTYYLIWLGLLGSSFLLNYKDFDLTNLAISVLFLYMSLRMLRNIPLFTIATMPIIGINFTRFSWRFSNFKENVLPVLDPILKFIYLIVIIILTGHGFTYGYRYRANSGKPFGLGIGSNMPVKAVAYAEENGLKGKCFNTYAYGAMIINKLYPETRVVMDSRDLPYGEELFLEHRLALLNVDEFKKMDEKYHLDYIMIDYISNDLTKHFEYLLGNNKEWALVYFNKETVIYVRREPQFAEVIKRDEYHCLHPVLTFQKNPLSLIKKTECLLTESLRNLMVDNEVPYSWLLWRRISLNLKRYDEALKEGEILLNKWPNDFKIYTFMAELYLLKEDKGKARDMLDKALSLNPKFKRAKDLLKKISQD